jgi:N-succinyldiaminopimelate aminotransferase
LRDVLDVEIPPAGFYLWPHLDMDDEVFTRELFTRQNITVLPGSYLSRESGGLNPGKHYVRMALVATMEECLEAANRIKEFMASL